MNLFRELFEPTNELFTTPVPVVLLEEVHLPRVSAPEDGEDAEAPYLVLGALGSP